MMRHRSVRGTLSVLPASWSERSRTSRSEPDQIRVRASVNRDAFVGDQSQVQVRMLTVVGGYYVTIVPLGNAPLGTRPIPKERVTMPYSLIQALSDTTKITEHVAPKPIKESIDQLQQGLRGTNVDSVAAVLNAGNSIADTLDRQRGRTFQDSPTLRRVH